MDLARRWRFLNNNTFIKLLVIELWLGTDHLLDGTSIKFHRRCYKLSALPPLVVVIFMSTD